MRACGLPRWIAPGGSGCCAIVRARCLPVSAWYGLAAVFVVINILAFNFVGDGLRYAADPYAHV